MAIVGFNESSLATSEIFSTFKDSGDGNNILDKVKETIKTAKHITNEDIEAAYVSVKQISESLTRGSLKMFDEGKIVLLYTAEPAKRISKALPFITFKTSVGHTTYVFMDGYIQVNRDGVMRVTSPTVLRDMLIGAAVSNGLKRNYTSLASNNYLQGILMEIYTKFVIRVLNREYSVIADRKTYDTLQYWINRFFLTKIYNTNDSSENVETVSSKHFKYIDEIGYQEIKSQYDAADPKQFSELLELIKTASGRMKSLSLRLFMSNWINYYYAPSMLAVDNVEYLIFMAITLLSGNSIISVAASDVVKEAKNVKSLRAELAKIL